MTGLELCFRVINLTTCIVWAERQKNLKVAKPGQRLLKKNIRSKKRCELDSKVNQKKGNTLKDFCYTSNLS